jgi:hypothetical protein
MLQDQTGAIIESDRQIIQQDDQGYGTITLQGRWVSDTSGKVEVRLVSEDTAVAATSAMDWQVAATGADMRWSISLTHIIDPDTAPMDLERYIPMLGIHGFVVE